MKYTLKLSFSFLVLLTTVLGRAQEAKETKKTDSIKPKTERYGLRVGIDLAKLSRSFYEKDYKGLELVGDFKVTRRHYLAAELGNENKTVDDDRLNFTTKGTYIKVGFDYNSYDNWWGMHNMIYVGLRYGVSTFSQTLNSYSIYNTHPYFEETPTLISGEKFDGLSAQWIEVVAGLKAEIVQNLYVGFSIRLNNLLTNKTPDNLDNLYIPGFNRTYGGKFGAGFNYTISYFVPIFKTTLKPKEKEAKNK
ncbi:DUF6048 family protein [Flavobacterium aciduliphilum]|uniref:Outer membrane protein with beta-barrel domain n=1 Tax=Flavobacterium aciduliphilum TaxID=1101402 RepID=A0A328YN97_9FLAO|nr:DUF6048 family protein [Flavobacterium aciduliphilum]RAR75521.1 hypothetical protein CLV55_101221 [Flavobacterium aciduliphilum]